MCNISINTNITQCLHYVCFDVLLTVHLSLILVNDQLHAQIPVFIISLLYSCTRFEHMVLETCTGI